ncbi:MAG: hypothetical protein ACOC2U_00250 [bacterium]
MRDKVDNYQTNYLCEKPKYCQPCFWYNGEQCIRQLLTEEDVKEILKEKEK